MKIENRTTDASQIISKALSAVKVGARGELSESEFNAVSSSPEFISALREKEQDFQSHIKANSPIDALVLNNRLSDTVLLRSYYLHFVKHPLLLTLREWFEIDPKGDPDLMRETFFALWNFDSDIGKALTVKDVLALAANSRVKDFYERRLKRSKVFRKMVHSELAISDSAKKEYCVRLVLENPNAKFPRECGENPFILVP